MKSVERLTEILEGESKEDIEKGIILSYLGKSEESLKYIETSPESITSYLLKLRIKEQLGQFSEGLELTETALKNGFVEKSEFGWYLYHLQGNFLMHHLKFAEAIPAF